MAQQRTLRTGPRRGMSRQDAGRKGGKIAHERGTAHEWTSEEAREAGRKGGLARAAARRQSLVGATAGGGMPDE